MKQTLILWSSALLLTFLTGYIHSGTSEYYPVTGTIGIDEKKVSYRFEKIFNDKDNYNFIIRTDNPDIEAVVKWREKNKKAWNTVRMKKENTALTAEIPRQDAGEKIFYFAEMEKDERKYTVPDKPVSLVFYNFVPAMINFLSSFALFGGLILTYRTGLSAIGGHIEKKKIKKLTLFTTAFFFVYAIAVTPLKNSYELNAINNKVLPITSLFDLHSILLFLFSIIAMVVIFNSKNEKPAAIVFSILTALIFLFVRN